MPLGVSVVIGSGREVDMRLDDSRVSSRHARIALCDGGDSGADNQGLRVTVEDLGSSNGTFVNGMAVDGPTWLALGDELLVGVTLLTLRGHSSAVPSLTSAYRAPRGSRQPVFDREGSFRSGELAELHRLLDVNVKRRANSAPPVLLALVVAIVCVYLVMR
jgi:pSer/pThr/pTyr-binding forkhead associated (FHA) protein